MLGLFLLHEFTGLAHGNARLDIQSLNYGLLLLWRVKLDSAGAGIILYRLVSSNTIYGINIATRYLLCPKKLGPLGQVRDIWLCLGVLCLKSQIPSTKLQINPPAIARHERAGLNSNIQ